MPHRPRPLALSMLVRGRHQEGGALLSLEAFGSLGESSERNLKRCG